MVTVNIAQRVCDMGEAAISPELLTPEALNACVTAIMHEFTSGPSTEQRGRNVGKFIGALFKGGHDEAVLHAWETASRSYSPKTGLDHISLLHRYIACMLMSVLQRRQGP